MPTAGFEPGSSGAGSNRSSNCATTTNLKWYRLNDWFFDLHTRAAYISLIVTLTSFPSKVFHLITNFFQLWRLLTAESWNKIQLFILFFPFIASHLNVHLGSVHHLREYNIKLIFYKLNKNCKKESRMEKHWIFCFNICQFFRLFWNKWANPGLFFIYFRLFNHTLQSLKQCFMWKNVFKYMVPGFKLTTFGTWVSFHNHWTRAPTLFLHLFRAHSSKFFTEN